MIVSLVHSAFLWLGDSALGHLMRDYTAPSSIAVVLHLLGLILLGGPTLLISFAVLGVIVRSPSASRVDRELWRFYLTGLALATLTGLAMVSSKADHYFNNDIFWVKLTLLATATLGSVLVHRHLRRVPSGRIVLPWRFVAALNVLLWTGVTIAGRGIGLF